MPSDGFHWRQQPEGLIENLYWASRSYIRYASVQSLPLFWTASVWNVSHRVIIGWFPWWARQLSSELYDGQNVMLLISDSTIPGIVLTQNIYNIVFNDEWVMAFLVGVTCIHNLWVHPPSKLYGFSQASHLFIYIFAKWGYCANHFLTGVISANISQTGPSSKHELWLDSIDWLVDNKLTCQ